MIVIAFAIGMGIETRINLYLSCNYVFAVQRILWVCWSLINISIGDGKV